MADVRKNEEIKVVKNPLLRQNFLLEEISGISFIVPPVSEKLEAENNGSSEGLEVPQVGVKRDGKAQETLSFTDIPLDVPETKEDSTLPPLPTPVKQEGSTFGLRSIIPSFVPLLVPQSFKQNTFPKEQETKPLHVENQATKRVITPETVVPQLVTAPSLENINPVPTFPNTLNKDVFSPVPSPIASASRVPSYAATPSPVSGRPPSATGSAHPVATPPPPAKGPPPLASNINRSGNTNPYALKRSHPSSTKSLSNESPYFIPHLQSTSNSSPFNPQVTESSVGPASIFSPSYSNNNPDVNVPSTNIIFPPPMSNDSLKITPSSETSNSPFPPVPYFVPTLTSTSNTFNASCETSQTVNVTKTQVPSSEINLSTANFQAAEHSNLMQKESLSASSSIHANSPIVPPPVSTMYQPPISILPPVSNITTTNIPATGHSNLAENDPHSAPLSIYANSPIIPPPVSTIYQPPISILPPVANSTTNIPATGHSNLAENDPHSPPLSIYANSPIIPPPVSTIYQPPISILPPVANSTTNIPATGHSNLAENDPHSPPLSIYANSPIIPPPVSTIYQPPISILPPVANSTTNIPATGHSNLAENDPHSPPLSIYANSPIIPPPVSTIYQPPISILPPVANSTTNITAKFNLAEREPHSGLSSIPANSPIIPPSVSTISQSPFSGLPHPDTNISSVNVTPTAHSHLAEKDPHSGPSSIPDNSPVIPPPVSTISQPPIGVLPPPATNINRTAGANPYTLKSSHHPSPFISKPAGTVPQVTSPTYSFFSQPNQTTYSSGPFNILSGPQVNLPSTTGHQLTATGKLDNNTEIRKLETNSVVEEVQNFPTVQSFTSAISNFIAPNKPSSDSSLDSKAKDLNPPASSFFYNTDSQQSPPISSALPQEHFIQKQQVDVNSNQENPVPPTIPFFNISNPINTNIIGLNSFGLPPSHTLITDNTVCVSSITTALSSVALASGISTNSSFQTGSPPYTTLNPQISTSENIPTSTPTEFNKQLLLINNNILENQQTLSSVNSNLFNNNITDNQVQVTNNLTNSNQSAASVNFTELVNNSVQLNPQSTVSLKKSEEVETCIRPGSHNPTSVKGENRSVGDISVSRGDVPVIQPIPTFNYFSSSQGTCLPPPLDQTKQVPQLPTASFFKPIEAPIVPTPGFPSQNNKTVQPYQTSTYTNPIPAASPKITFPPPNITPNSVAVAKNNMKTEPPIKSDLKSGENVDVEELEQIQLEGSAVPLYKPDYHPRVKQEKLSGEAGNSYRLGGGFKKPTYAPVPELGVTGKKSFPTESSPSNSLSSQEEMAAIEAHGSSRTTPPQGNTSPSNSTSLDAYYTNLLQAPSYRPPYHHWFFKSGQHKKSPWTPFSMADSLNLEQVYTSSELTEDTKVPTDGGRYDVEIVRRKKTSVYWEENPGEVRRCAWFVKSVTDSRYTPYDENIAALLEDEYKMGCESNDWNRRIELADGEVIILHSPTAMAHHVRSSSPDTWGAQSTLQQKPRVVKRGVEDFNISKGEPKQVDHLLLMVHGVGKACDLRFRSLVEVVDDFRSIAQQLVGSHFHSGVENGNVGRVEILPVEWHGALHTETINDRLSAITLPSIPRAREFTNETLLDILFYTSPVFAERIVQAVGEELNRVVTLYKTRNPGFRGQISLGGHSLGSLILFDILCHQKMQRIQLSTQSSIQSEEDESMDELGCLQKTKARLSRRMSYLTIGPGTGQPYSTYPQLLFQPRSFFALGSPIGMFVTVRGLESLGEDFRFPTCPAFFNIFHPNDPVAYRIEALIKPEMATVPAVLIPHHKGRKRMHLELKETMTHVTAALKQKLVDSMKNTWNAVYHLTLFNRKDNSLQGDVNTVIEDEVLRDLETDPPLSMVGEEGAGSDVKVGRLNGGRRVDYVLQEAPLETFNQYISAIRSHLVYWESEDTALMILKEIYGGMGISPDTQVPQPILPFDITGDVDSFSDYTYSIGALPTQFIRK